MASVDTLGGGEDASPEAVGVWVAGWSPHYHWALLKVLTLPQASSDTTVVCVCVCVCVCGCVRVCACVCVRLSMLISFGLGLYHDTSATSGEAPNPVLPCH